MDSNCFIGELLYIGFLTEKNRCGSYRWPMGYKRVLKIHLSELKNIATLFNDSVNTEQVICHFRQVCKSEKTIGKYYEKIEWNNFSFSDEIYNSYPQIVCYICQLLDVALFELKKIKTDKKKVNRLLRCLHNLPRVFLSKNEGDHMQMRASERDVIDYMLLNADDEIKSKLGI